MTSTGGNFLQISTNKLGAQVTNLLSSPKLTRDLEKPWLTEAPFSKQGCLDAGNSIFQ